MNWKEIQRREIINHNQVEISETETVLIEQTTVFTTVEYNFDGTVVTVEIPHFMPPDEAYITQGIENRAITEQRKLGLIP